MSQKSHASIEGEEEKEDSESSQDPGTLVNKVGKRAVDTCLAAKKRAKKKTPDLDVTQFAEHFKPLGVEYKLKDLIIDEKKQLGQIQHSVDAEVDVKFESFMHRPPKHLLCPITWNKQVCVGNSPYLKRNCALTLCVFATLARETSGSRWPT